MRQNPIDSKNAGLRNESLILDLLRKHGRLSQAEICKLTGLGSSTASYITARLREKNLILEKPGKSKKRGPKPIILSINPQGRFIAAASFKPTSITLCLFDFNCRVVEKLNAPAEKENSVESFCDSLQINLLGLLSKYNISQKDLLGIGVALSGSIAQNGMVKLSSPLGWKNVPLKEMLNQRLDCPVEIYPTRVRFLAEISTDPEFASKTVLYINVADGVGGTLYTDGKIMNGASGRFGELGHVVIDPNGPMCGCGQRGCLEAFISGPSLSRTIKTDISNVKETVLKNMIESQDTPEQIVNKWGQAVAENDSYALSLRQMVAEHLSKATAIGINCYDPDVVMLTGYVANQCMDYLTASIKGILSTEVFDSTSRIITVTNARFDKDALTQGLAMAVLQDSAPL